MDMSKEELALFNFMLDVVGDRLGITMDRRSLISANTEDLTLGRKRITVSAAKGTDTFEAVYSKELTTRMVTITMMKIDGDTYKVYEKPVGKYWLEQQK